ncbi:MAG: LuxR C-terminal-related transcriptional regulator [Stappiaceae bacterium]
MNVNYGSKGFSSKCAAAENLDEFLDDIEQAETIDAVWNVCLKYFQAMDFEHVNYIYMRPASAGKEIIALSSLPGWWSDYYMSSERVSKDPFIHLCETFATKRTCPEFLHHHPYLSAPERLFINEAGETGMTSGFAAPVSLVGNDWWGGWNFGTALNASKFDKLCTDTVERDARLMGLYAHQRICVLNQSEIDISSKTLLSQREKTCLTYIAMGFRTTQIADTLDLSNVTVDFHLKNARKKLHAATREQAVAKAIALGHVVTDY